MAKIRLPNTIRWNGRDISTAEALERVLNEDKSSESKQESEQIVPQTNAPDLKGYIPVPSINAGFSIERTLYGSNWQNTHRELYKKGLEMPTPRETWELIFHLQKNLSNPVYRQVYDDILKTTPENKWHGEWQNAIFSSDNGKIYVQQVTGVNSKGELVLSKKEKLEVCLMQDCWADINSGNKQGLLTKAYGSSYEQGKNIYFWYPRENCVARFDAGSGGAVLSCFGRPDYSLASLGVRAIRRAFAKNSGGRT